MTNFVCVSGGAGTGFLFYLLRSFKSPQKYY